MTLLSRRLTVAVRTVPELVRRAGGRPDSCILQCRVLLEALRNFGIAAKPMPVDVHILNPPYHRHVEDGTGVETEAELMALHAADGSWTIGLGVGEGAPGKWSNGHLIVLGDGWMADPSLGQASRPDRDINLEPLLAPVSADFWAGRRNWLIMNGCALGYASTHNDKFRDLPDWTVRHAGIDRLVSQTIWAIKRCESTKPMEHSHDRDPTSAATP